MNNAGWTLKPLAEGEDVPDSIKIRGFNIVKKETKVFEFMEAGEFVCS